MKYCINCGRQLQNDEQCNCSNISTEASETAASAEEGGVTDTNDYFYSYSEVSSTPKSETSMNQETDQNNQASHSYYPYQWDQTFQSNQAFQYKDASQEDQAFQYKDASQEDQAFQNNDASQGNHAFQNNDASQGNQNFQGNANGFAQAGPTQKQKAVKTGVFSTALKNVFPFIKAFIKSPSSALHTSAENTDLPLAGIFYAVYCIAWILFQSFAVSKVFGLFSGYTSYLYSFGQSYIKISYPYVILTGLILSLLSVIITNLFMVCLGLIARSKYNFKQIVAASSGIFVLPAICFLLATILLFISLPISICVLIIGNVAYLLLFYYTGKTLFQKNDNSPFLWVMILLTATLLIVTTLTSLKISMSFSSKLVRTQAYNIFGTESYDDSSDLDDFYQFFE